MNLPAAQVLSDSSFSVFECFRKRVSSEEDAGPYLNGNINVNSNVLLEIHPDSSSLAEKGEAKSPQESPYKAIYFSVFYAYALINNGQICLKN